MHKKTAGDVQSRRHRARRTPEPDIRDLHAVPQQHGRPSFRRHGRITADSGRKAGRQAGNIDCARVPAPAGDNENEIRSVNVYLGARSTSTAAATGKYVRTNLATQVALRSMAYFNTYQ